MWATVKTWAQTPIAAAAIGGAIAIGVVAVVSKGYKALTAKKS